ASGGTMDAGDVALYPNDRRTRNVSADPMRSTIPSRDATTPWWVNLAWRLYAPAPAGLDPVMRRLRRLARPLADVARRVFVQHGPAHPDGEVGSLVVAGRRALGNPISARFFVRPPCIEPVGVVPLWRLRATLARLGASADATLVALDRWTAARLF